MSFSILHHGGLNQALVAQTFMIAIAPVSVHIVPQSFRPTSRNLQRAPVYLITSAPFFFWIVTVLSRRGRRTYVYSSTRGTYNSGSYTAPMEVRQPNDDTPTTARLHFDYT